MKTTLLLVGLGAIHCSADPFVNLTFDDPDLSGPLTPVFPGGPLEGNTDQLLRGWTVAIDGQVQSRMVYSPPGTGSGGPVNLLQGISPFGPYEIYMFSRFPQQPEIRVSQTATMPTVATFLWIHGTGYIQAYADETKIGEVNTVFSTYAFLDVSSYAGREVTLGFILPPGGRAEFDIVGFTSVPEPSTWALLGLGLGALVWQFRRRG
ncbi:MAG TPA: PEP-CTERM sorting domain-containing protein [Verrucomicrobiota bacterium]|nr:hypothetical protein [Verrucomicrobiales bacterium]HRI16501.1 PEP-CTERM sorting domain-containing protein [Verrucomicrobiota bacterium]